MAGHDHPFFTRAYKLIVRLEDGGSVGRARQQVSSVLSGRVLIVGLGPAEDLHHLPPSVTSVVAVEPSPSMRRAARPAVERAESRGLPVTVVDAVAEDLPFPDDAFDGVLSAYVLCTVDDPGAAIAEARRVLRPDGVVAVLEHVKGAPGTWADRSQRLVTRVWPRLAGGCRCDRDTRAALQAGGFRTDQLTDEVLVNLPPVAPVIMGTATLADSSS